MTSLLPVLLIRAGMEGKGEAEKRAVLEANTALMKAGPCGSG